MSFRLDRRPNRHLVGLDLELQFPMAVEEILILVLEHANLLLQVLILCLQAIHLLLEMHIS